MIIQSWDKTIAICSHHGVPNSKILLLQNYEILPFMWNQQPTDISRVEIPLTFKTKASNWTRYSVVIFILPSVASRYFLVLSVHILHRGQDPSHPASWLKPCQWISVTQYNSAMKEERSNKLPTATVLEAPRKYHLPEIKWAVLQRRLMSLTIAAEKCKDTGHQTSWHTF